MRLLEFKSDGGLSLTEDFVNDVPKYAILSHTWGLDTEEVTFEDLKSDTYKDKLGFRKICFCGKQARRDGLRYFWVDTCCIDKSSSAELTEAINSMFHWYRNAQKCYVYLLDVSTNDDDQDDPSWRSWQSTFERSRWFKRGWTLQELIAPLSVEFFCLKGNSLGNKENLEQLLHKITGIAVVALRGRPISEFSIEERMSWAKDRDTKRGEDKAYSLLGIFDIHMPLIYGEGQVSAFRRLRQELYQREEVSITSHAFNASKRLKTAHNQPSNALHIQGYENFENFETGKDSIMRANPSIDDTTEKSLIDQLYFPQVDERVTNLAAAHRSTCRWFLAKPEYISWQDLSQQAVHGGFLWIKGHPGTGKSTLMKFLFEEAMLRTKSIFSQITISFFFLARGTVEEKSATGLYRSLLHQLFEKAVDLRASLEWMTADGTKVIQRNGWREEALKQTLTHAVEKLENRLLTIFIDALDECDEKQVADMISFFEELCDRAIEVEVRLQICFSSRHYPTVVIERGIEVTLEDEVGHTEDIRRYIKSKLRVGKTAHADGLQSEILEKSSQIFLWVVLVLEILNSEYRKRSISIKKIRERLEEIPPGLNDLFEMILGRDGENLDRLQLCLEFILFAARPLKPQELYFAIQLGLDKECSTYWDQEDVNLGQMKSFVSSSSKGLAEVTRHKSSKVQFIHESVREFLLVKYESQWCRASGSFVGHGHEVLKNCCLAQLNASKNENVDMPPENVRLKFPFLEYSIHKVLRHANSAQQNGMNQENFLANFPLQDWVVFNNAFEKFKLRRYSESVSSLYILAVKNLADLIQIHPQRQAYFFMEHERYGTPIFAALANRSREAVQMFLESHANNLQYGPSLRHLCEEYSKNRGIHGFWDPRFSFSRRKGFLAQIIEQGDDLLLTFCLALDKFDIEAKASNKRTPLFFAAERGLEGPVKLLLDKGAKLEATNSSGFTPLLVAAQRGHNGVVKMLLDRGAELEAKTCFDYTSSFLAAELGHKEVVEVLLEKGAELGAINNSSCTPLLVAAESGHKGIVKLLLDRGAELEAKNRFDETPLLRAAKFGYEEVVKLLLEKGAELEAKDQWGQTPLLKAAKGGHESVVKMLLEEDVELEARHGPLYRPSSPAVIGRYVGEAEVLLAEGAKREAEFYNTSTPLGWAAWYGHKEVVKLMLRKGAKLETEDQRDTPLLLAVKRGRQGVVKLLLAQDGINLNAVNREGLTPLSWAIKYGREEMVKLLSAPRLTAPRV